MLSALAQIESLSILSRYVFSTHAFCLFVIFMLEFTRDGASWDPKAIVWTENEKQSCTQISTLTEIGAFSVRYASNLWQMFENICHKLDA